MKRMRFALFLGCTTPTKVPQYELSARWVARHLDIELVDVEDLACCGSNQVNLSLEAGLLMAAMNLALVENQGLDLITLCGGCTGALTEAREELKNEEVRDRINKKLSAIGLTYQGKCRVRHFSRVLYEDIGLSSLKEKVKRDLSKLKTAPHYGCHYLKPKGVYEGFDEPDNPKTLHRLILATGATLVEYDTLLLCCGGKTFPNAQDISFSLAGIKLENLMARGVDFITLQCNTCYVMYGLNQPNIAKKLGKPYNIPALLYPQLLGLAMGADPRADLGLHLNIPFPGKIFETLS
ncbi:MAG: CoB--CoM heterodisulfide reductase iron-sulfur subunit B family protein [bacterium]